MHAGRYKSRCPKTRRRVYNRPRNRFHSLFKRSFLVFVAESECALNGFALRRCLSRQSQIDWTAFEMDTPKQATQCCRTVCCHLHVHRECARYDQICCRTRVQMRAVSGSPPSSVQGVPQSLLALDVRSVFNHSHPTPECVAAFAEHAHDPPAFR